MRFPLAALVASLLLAAAGSAGCGLATDGGGSGARVLVTRDFGAREVGAQIVQDLPSSATVLSLLGRGSDVDAGAGGGWRFYVNGIESDGSAGDVKVHDGDRIWWDLHDRGAASHVPAVVGQFPEPFAHGADGKRYPVVLECADDADAACQVVSDRLGAVGVIAGRQALGTGTGERTVRVLVGRWSELRADQALEQLDRGPAASGVYARFAEDGRSLELLGADGKPVRTLGEGAGLVAATRFEQQAPTWVVTGTDATGVANAARALDERTLARRFALALDGSKPVGLPAGR